MERAAAPAVIPAERARNERRLPGGMAGSSGISRASSYYSFRVARKATMSSTCSALKIGLPR
jgi:hypothetical protein